MKKIKKNEIPVNQYAYEFATEADKNFLKETAPIIGFIIIKFNSLEGCLNSHICEYFIDDNDTLGLQVIYKRKYQDKVDLFKRLYEDTQTVIGKKMPTFNTLIEHLEKSGKFRNTVVHTNWENVNDEGYTMSKLKIKRKGISYEYTQFTEDSLKNILEYINEAYEMFDIFEEEREELFRD